MVKEREPPKASLSSSKFKPETARSQMDVKFGTTSPLRSRLPELPRQQVQVSQASEVSSLSTKPFNPNAGQGLILQPASSYNPQIGRMSQPEEHKRSAEGSFKIPIPVDDVPSHTIAAQPRPTYTVFGQRDGNTVSSNAGAHASNPLDLTEHPRIYGGLGYPYSGTATAYLPAAYVAPGEHFVDSSQATESIKALLQGAVEDEDEEVKPRTRRRKAKKQSDDLVERLQNLKASKGGVIPEASQTGSSSVETEEPEEESEDEDDGSVDGLAVKLLPHQVEGLRWMTNKEVAKRKDGVLPKGGILADDMGLGKTLQSIALILSNPRPSPKSTEYEQRKLPSQLEKSTLVVAPLALIKQWEKELKDKVSSSHSLRVCVHHGPQRTKRYDDLKRYDVVITTYQVLVSEHGKSSPQDNGLKVGCFGLRWYRVILDEAHTIKNRNAKATQACYALQAQYRWCLTGTPMQNHLDELQSLIRFLRIKPYNNLAVWREQITNPMKAGRGAAALKRLQYYLKIFMKRRTKDVLKQEGALGPSSKKSGATGARNGFKITERRVEEVVADFAPRERRFYERLEQRADERLEQMMGGRKMNYASALVLLLRLRQACNHAQLVAGKLTGDMDALAVDAAGRGSKSAGASKAKASEKSEVDDVADLLGGLSVETKTCEVCQAELEPEAASSGAFRCDECEADLSLLQETKPRKKKAKKRNGEEEESILAGGGRPGRPVKHRPRVVDSDDEDEQGNEAVGSEIRGTQDGEVDEESDDDDDDGQPIKTEDIVRLAMAKKEQSESTDKEETELDADVASDDDDDSALSTLSASTKIRRVLKLLHKESERHKFIVFSQFTSMLDLLEPFLQRDGLVYARYDGKMRNDLREASLDRLRDEHETRILLCSLKCGSLGLNLTAASRVIILEPFWNPFIEEQAIDRVHRLNQTVDVVVYKITIRNTVEERILALQEKKRTLANAAIEGKAVGKLSLKDIMELFRRDGARANEELDVDFMSKFTRDRVLTAPASQVGSSCGELQAGGKAPARGGHSAQSRVEDSAYARRW